MNSKEVKATMLSHMLYRLSFSAAITEYGGQGLIGIADVFGIQKSGFTHEFEVKVAKSDLAGELKAIEYWKQPENEKGILFASGGEKKHAPVSKGGKHHIYLKGETHPYMFTPRIPNKFSFVVPFELQEYALEGIKGTPYGLFCISEHENGGHPWWDVGCQKKAGYLHKEKASPEIASNILHKACTEVENLRRQTVKGLRCTSCFNSLPTRCGACDENIKRERARSRAYSVCNAKADGFPWEERSTIMTDCLKEHGF